LFIQHRGKRYGFEFKIDDSPRMSKSMHVALEDLKLTQLYIVHPGEGSHPVHERVSTLALSDLGQLPKMLAKRIH
jgi:uncharacterized protein